MKLIRDHVSTAVLPKIADKAPLPEPASSPGPNPSDLAVRAAASYGIKRTSVTIFAPESSYQHGDLAARYQVKLSFHRSEQWVVVKGPASSASATTQEDR